jgi:hypothetical protein
VIVNGGAETIPLDTSIHLTDSRSHAAQADGYVEDPKIRRIEDKRNLPGWRLVRQPDTRHGRPAQPVCGRCTGSQPDARSAWRRTQTAASDLRFFDASRRLVRVDKLMSPERQ